MARPKKSWTVTVNGVDRFIEFYPMTFSKRAKLLIDGEPAPLDVSASFYQGIDQPILTGGDRDLRIVSKGKFTDLSVDGVLIDSQKPYEPLPKLSRVSWVFVIISLCAALLGGLIPSLCAIGGAALNAGVALKKGLSGKARIILGVVIAILTWGAAIGLSIAFVWGSRAVGKVVPKKFGNEKYSITLSGFEADRDTKNLEEDGFEIIFAAYSDKAYVFAKSVASSKLRILYGVDWRSTEEYLKEMFSLSKDDIKRLDSNGLDYAVVKRGGYTYLLTVVCKDNTFYYTEFYTTTEYEDEVFPKFIEYAETIKID